MRIAGGITDTTSWKEPRITSKISAFLENFVEKPEDLKTGGKKAGSPHTIIVSSSGVRAADLVR